MKSANSSSSMNTSTDIRVRFVTSYDEYRISDAPFAVPSTLSRQGLSEIINHFLGTSDQPFDFLIKSQLLRTTLSKFLFTRHISTEEILVIEYIPALTLSDQKNTVETPAWVGSLNCSVPGKVYAGCFDGKVQLFESDTLSLTGHIDAHAEPIACMEVISPTNDVEQKVWQAASAYLDSDIAVESIVCTGSKDRTIKCFAVGPNSSSALVATLEGHSGSVQSLRLDALRGVLLSGDWNGNVFGWDLRGLLEGDAGDQDHGEVVSKKKAKSSKAGKPRAVLNPKDLKHSFFFRAHSQCVSGIRCVPMSNRAFTCSWDHTVKEWDLETQDPTATMSATKVATSCDYSTLSNTLVTSHTDGRVRLWDSRTHEGNNEGCVNSFGVKGEAVWVSQASWSPASAFLFASSDYMGKVRLWDTRASVALGVSESHEGKALCVDWSTTSSGDATESSKQTSALISGGSDCTVQKSHLCG